MICRNCASDEHKTQECKDFGPWYPEVGKHKWDYADVTKKVEAAVAAEILAEHEENHAHDAEEAL